MADGVAITAGSGTTILTDDTGAGGHAQVVKLAISTDASGTLIPADAANGIDVDVTRLPALPAGTNNIGDVDVLTVPADPFGVNADAASATGSVSAKLRFIASTGIPITALPALVAGNANIGDVDVASIAAGTNYIGKVRLTDGTNDTSVSTTGSLYVGGSVAHDGVDSGNPIKVGMRAIAHGANPTAVAAADRTDLLANRAGIPFVMGGHPNIVTARTTYSAAAQTDVAIGPGTVAAGTKVVVTQIQITVSNPTTATPAVRVGFGATNTPTGTGVVISHPGIPGGGGVSRGDGSGILGVGADGEELRITADAATGGVLDCVVSYYTIES